MEERKDEIVVATSNDFSKSSKRLGLLTGFVLVAAFVLFIVASTSSSWTDDQRAAVDNYSKYTCLVYFVEHNVNPDIVNRYCSCYAAYLVNHFTPEKLLNNMTSEELLGFSDECARYLP